MQVAIDKKFKIILYLIIFFTLSTVNFLEIEKINKNNFFPLKIIEIKGTSKIDIAEISKELNFIIGKNIFFLKKQDFLKYLKENNLIKSFEITKHYPDKIEIKITEVKFIGLILKNKKKYFLTDNEKLINLNKDLNKKKLPHIYGLNGEKYFYSFYEKLLLNDFNINLVKSYYFFQVNRWDFILNNNLLIKLPSNDVDEAIILIKKLINNPKFKNLKVIDLRINGKIITK